MAVPLDDVLGWEALYRRMYPRLFAYCRRRLASDHDADEAVAETMVRAVSAVDRYVERGIGIDGWLFGICRNVLHERWRSEVRDRRWAVVGAALVAPEAAGPAEHAIARDEQERLLEAFARLSDEEQEVLELRVAAGLDAEQVGDALGKRPGAVRMAQSRALAHLRTYLEEVR
jgi:RNA polymerase sigma-70 factor (ECF subfamily)